MSGSTETTDALKHAMVEQLMGVIAAPDDEDVARAADAVVRELDALLRAEQDPAA
ncbi:hypothetical protein [Streptomyces anatolicus]|uniref:hypothetical protein n=1 Tax=Streptomyces anatolicus TaxID=2675858 RepID=UPI001CA4A5E1|nr:hypothetical protein [Streptomyces anatolicus]